ncbi:histidine phosphatase family protein [Catellatospora coxensis]|uniref:Phosphoglycerate mutase n=1 Tax=Catellatospora coxensis TaxID=310354 RepID=A0A8J3P9M8_9ACTN|nr:histidine phosphatase family protein [Catellatospora coxensis]GIG08508.1 phosphoglycerate mutase [Catellatospora coxensis]
MAVSLVYETHSPTLDNEAGFATGWLPGELSPAGLERAAELGERRRGEHLDLVVSSDLRRAVQTARIAFGGSGVEHRTDARLREINYGELNGMPVARLDAERARRVDAPFPGGESYRQVVERTADLLEELAATHDGRRVLLVAHAANRYALAVLLGGADLAERVGAPFTWQPGWEYTLPAGWVRPAPGPSAAGSAR